MLAVALKEPKQKSGDTNLKLVRINPRSTMSEERLTLKPYLGYCSTPCDIFCLYLWIVWRYWLASHYTFLSELRFTVVNSGNTILTCGHIYDSSGVQLYPTVLFVQMYFSLLFLCVTGKSYIMTSQSEGATQKNVTSGKFTLYAKKQWP